MTRKRNYRFTEKDLARYVITSKESAETFITRWMARHKSTRHEAIKRLKQLGIQLNQLRDKQ